MPASQGERSAVNADEPLETGADVLARMLDTADRIRSDTPGTRTGWVFLFLADARLLDRLAGGGWSVEDCAMLAERIPNSVPHVPRRTSDLLKRHGQL